MSDNNKAISIIVSVGPTYLPEQSDILSQKFVWSYEITIINDSEKIVQLLNRYWRIVDMAGRMEEVRAPGVVGLQPLIWPENKFAYKSFCQLPTPQGTMEGHYEMQDLNKTQFKVTIPKFILSSPSTLPGTFRSKLH